MIPSVTEVLSKYQDFSKVPEGVLNAGALRGSSVHAFCAAYATGLWSKMESGTEGYCRSFREWFDRYVGEVILVEKRLHSEVYGYHGQPDFFGKLKGDFRPRIIDWKTPLAEGKTWKIQVAAYKHLFSENGYLDVSDILGCGAGYLRLRSDGTPAIYTASSDTKRDFMAFLNALTAHKYILG